MTMLKYSIKMLDNTWHWSAEPGSSKLSEKKKVKTCVSGKCYIPEWVVIY